MTRKFKLFCKTCHLKILKNHWFSVHNSNFLTFELFWKLNFWTKLVQCVDKKNNQKIWLKMWRCIAQLQIFYKNKSVRKKLAFLAFRVTFHVLETMSIFLQLFSFIQFVYYQIWVLMDAFLCGLSQMWPPMGNVLGTSGRHFVVGLDFTWVLITFYHNKNLMDISHLNKIQSRWTGHLI